MKENVKVFIVKMPLLSLSNSLLLSCFKLCFKPNTPPKTSLVLTRKIAKRESSIFRNFAYLCFLWTMAKLIMAGPTIKVLDLTQDDAPDKIAKSQKKRGLRAYQLANLA